MEVEMQMHTRARDEIAAVATERLEAEVQTGAALLAAATCQWLLRIAELDRREAWASWECRSMAHWLSWKCAMSLRTGREHVRVARALETLPHVRAEFSAGRLSYSKVRSLTRVIREPELERQLVDLALATTASQLDVIAAGCDRVRRINDPEREQRTHDERRLSYVLDDDGTGTVTMRGPVDLLAELLVAIDAAVDHETANDGEGIEARRFDAMLALGRRAAAPDSDADAAADVAHPSTLVIRAQASNQSAGALDLADDPAEPITARRLPISRAAYERLRCDARVAIERVLDDGRIERTPTTDTIPRAVRRAVRDRDLGRCRWPGCGSRSSIHLHHIVWRSRGGSNAVDNIVSLCHFHHRAVHHRGWSGVGTANGALRFVDGRGRVADEHTYRSAAVQQRTLARAQTRLGCAAEPSTIATALGDRLDRSWAIGTVFDNEEVVQSRN